MPCLRGMMFMNNHVLINYEKGLNYPERCELLVSGVIKSIFPVGLIKENRTKRGIFDTTGYIRLKDIKEISINELLNLIVMITIAFDRIREYPVFIEEMVISLDTTFVDESFSEIKFIYVLSNRYETEEKTFIYLLHLVKKKVLNDNYDIVGTIIKHINNNGFNTMKIRELIGEIKYELN